MRRLIASALVALAATPIWANQDGTTTATFLRIGQGARAEGMGGAFTAVADDAHAVYWNPAGLAQITRRQLGLNHVELIEKINSQFAAFVLPVNKMNGSLGVSATYVDLGSIERYDKDNANNPVAASGDEEVTAYSANVSWGQALGDRLAIGGGVKIINQNLAGETGSGVAADLGGLFFLVPNRLALGVAALNLGPKIKTGTTDEDIPRTITAGLAFYVIPKQFVLAIDGQKEMSTDTMLHLGGEYIFQGRYMLRAGFQETHEAGGGLSAGLGYLWRPRVTGSTDFFGKSDAKAPIEDGLDIRIDYSYVDLGDFDATHRFGVHLAF